jgi:hypothetical protein
LKRTVQMKRMRKMRRKKKYVQSSDFQKWNKTRAPSSVLYTLTHNRIAVTYCWTEMMQDLPEEQYKRGTQTKISLFFKHSLNIK